MVLLWGSLELIMFVWGLRGLEILEGEVPLGILKTSVDELTKLAHKWFLIWRVVGVLGMPGQIFMV